MSSRSSEKRAGGCRDAEYLQLWGESHDLCGWITLPTRNLFREKHGFGLNWLTIAHDVCYMYSSLVVVLLWKTAEKSGFRPMASPGNVEKMRIFKKSWKTRILGVDSHQVWSYNPPPLSLSGQRQSDFWSSLESRSLFEKVGSILEEIRGRRYVITCRPLWYNKVSLLKSHKR